MSEQLTWLVTGCSSGFGEAFVHAILAAGDRVIATSRSQGAQSAAQRLAALQAAGAAVMELDLGVPEDELSAKAKEAWSIYGHIDVLVNNAGSGKLSPLEETNEAFLVDSLRSNVLGPLNLTRSLLPYMRSRHSGTLLFVNSKGPYHAAPATYAYAGVKGLLEGAVPPIAAEVEPFGIRTCLLVVGQYRTDIMNPEKIMYNSSKPQPAYDEVRNMIYGYSKMLHGKEPGDPRKAADVVVEAVKGVGRCSGMKLPLRLPLGADAFQSVRNHSLEKIDICDKWESITGDTDFD